MTNYRILTIDQDGQTIRSRQFVCDNDENAVVWAEQQLEHDVIELWSGDRKVKQLSPKRQGSAVSRKIYEGKMIPTKVKK